MTGSAAIGDVVSNAGRDFEVIETPRGEWDSYVVANLASGHAVTADLRHPSWTRKALPLITEAGQ